MTVPLVHHLVTVWNPSYAANAMDEHLRLLREWVQRLDAGEVDEESLYVWWGKVKSSNRQQPMRHAGEVRAAAEASREERHEVHLYLTDYRALYVAEVIDVRDGDLPDDERPHAPSYYAANDLRCDFWFKLGDIRRLVADDTLAVVEELQQLRNVHYNDRPVSIYGGMVDLPLVVTRPDGRDFFGDDERRLLADDRLWVEYDAESGAGVGTMERELRENRFGDALWMALEPAARTSIATAEWLFRQHRGDPAFDFAPVLNGLAKAVEVQANSVLHAVLPRIPRSARWTNIAGQSVDLLERRMMGLGEIARAIDGDQTRYEAMKRLLEQGAWFTGSFPSIVDALRQERNPASHATIVDRATAASWRARLLGVGCEGDLLTLARVRLQKTGSV